MAFSGGGIYAKNTGDFTMFNTIIRYNSAGDNGGGLSLAAAASRSSGGDCDPNQYQIVNCLLHDNTAGDDGGAIRMGNNAAFFVGNSTFSENIAGRNGGAIDIISTPCVKFRNAIFWNDSAPTGPEMHKLGNLGGADITIDYCDVKGGQNSLDGAITWLTNNIDADPLFVNPANDVYHLECISPAADAGDNAQIGLDPLDINDNGSTTEALPWDLDGQSRVLDDPCVLPGAVVDMGAYEFAMCPDALVFDADPPDGTHDARQPHPINDNNFNMRQGIGSPNSSGGGPEPITVDLGIGGAHFTACWSLCETGIEQVESGTPPLSGNFIKSVTETAAGVYEVLLDRPISAGEWTTIKYTSLDTNSWETSYASLPADANADGLSHPNDLTHLTNFTTAPRRHRTGLTARTSTTRA